MDKLLYMLVVKQQFLSLALLLIMFESTAEH